MKKNVIGGYNLTCLGNDAHHSYIPSKYKVSPSDHALIKSYKSLEKAKKYSFEKAQMKDIQLPGVDLPVTTVFRSKFGKFKEYHTSLDNFNFINYKALNESFKVFKNQ